MKIKERYFTHPLEMLQQKMMTSPSAGKDEDQVKHSYAAGENAKRCHHFGNSLWLLIGLSIHLYDAEIPLLKFNAKLAAKRNKTYFHIKTCK